MFIKRGATLMLKNKLSSKIKNKEINLRSNYSETKRKFIFYALSSFSLACLYQLLAMPVLQAMH